MDSARFCQKGPFMSNGVYDSCRVTFFPFIFVNFFFFLIFIKPANLGHVFN